MNGEAAFRPSLPSGGFEIDRGSIQVVIVPDSFQGDCEG